MEATLVLNAGPTVLAAYLKKSDLQIGIEEMGQQGKGSTTHAKLPYMTLQAHPAALPLNYFIVSIAMSCRLHFK